jgi:predicted DNA-binding transcriptional regulator AlpA
MTLETMLTTKQLADLLQISVGCVRNWRAKTYGPRPTRIGRMIRYRASDVERWLAREIPGISRDAEQLRRDAEYWGNVREKAVSARQALRMK